MTFSDEQILTLPQRALHDRDVRHEWYRQQEQEKRRSVALVPAVAFLNAVLRIVYADAVDAEVSDV